MKDKTCVFVSSVQVLTASGDGTVHIWQCAVHLYNESSSGRVASSEDELDPGEKVPHHGGGGGGREGLGFSSGVEEDNQVSEANLKTTVLLLPWHALWQHHNCGPRSVFRASDSPAIADRP